MMRTWLALALSFPLLQGCNALSSAPSEDLPSPLEVAELVATGALEVPPIGEYRRQVSGASPEAQVWFDQGLRYTYGFNQDQAAACFARAALASPDCAMAWWGISHIYSGVDINNNAVTPDEASWGFVAQREAERLASTATALERALIAAAGARAVLPMPSPMERSELDEEYRAEMKELWESYPGDVDVGTLYAEAMMCCQPWEYWTSDYEPVKRAEAIVTQLERCIELGPRHPGAHHLYIHIVESSGRAERGVASADLLGELMPGSGHLVHMPSHIYINVGRYDDAIRVNQRAVELDDVYMAAYGRPTFYLNYYAHNVHFTAFGAMMEGRRALALQYADKLSQVVPEPVIEQFASYIDGMNALRMHIYIRFGMWDEILEHPEYPEFRKASRAIRRYARTMALANLGHTEEARRELAHLDLAVAEIPEDWYIAFNPAQTVLGVARRVAEAEIYWREGDPERAIQIMKDTLRTEHDLVYTEPPPWMIPIRHALGAIQLASGDALGAEMSYRENLMKHPENAWSLLGLQQALTKQGKEAQATAMEARVERAWARADVEPPASCYCAVPLKP